MHSPNFIKFIVYDHEDEYACELFVEAHSNGFSGQSSAWFSHREILEFADMLKPFPIPKDKLPKLSGEYWDAAQTVLTPHVQIQCYWTDQWGSLGIKVLLAFPPKYSVTLEIIPSYNDLPILAKDLADLIDGKLNEVILYGQPLLAD